MLDSILNPVLSLGGLGLLFGGGLAIASRVFEVKVDPKVEQIQQALPGANCGACGYPGCAAFAEAVASEKAPVNGCPVGGSSCAESLGAIMGVSADAGEKQVARVICGGKDCNAQEKFEYNGIKDCKSAAMVQGGSKSCSYGCLGLGSCVEVCPFDAIKIVDGIANIDKEKCTACEKCIVECPKNVIEMAPYDQKVVVDCNSKEFGKDVKVKCTVGCIGCQICVKACPFDAMEFENKLAKINYDKCTNCMVCAEKCPTNSIWADFESRKTAEVIEDKCIGCTICAKKCPVDAIEGELKGIHKVIEDKCIGCGICYEKCPKDAIKMK
ncbi:RnfABCDGE type electron transport complex subunit B [Sporosalibacterium faouarense]|uniref:RnfABCDGE type electron transport complex subunit B n=1 Tax=Sporosalibacterium faouarense TaxID=516123 RepID=UPI00141C4F18|nr:RnfABCDGE type electron transport complex subunit B [Sporosalibacterium faouarense]MTI48548.1 RnfABCDGE type electron transport complex subunit B [Bacillota bacterium]